MLGSQLAVVQHSPLRFETWHGHATAITFPRKSVTIMAITALKALATYFNTGTIKKPLREFSAEVKELNDTEKDELGRLAAEALGEEYAGLKSA